MEDIISQVLEFLSGYPKFVIAWGVFTSVVTIASVIVKATKTQKDDAVVAKILWVLSLNKGPKPVK